MSNILTTHPADYITVSMARLIGDGDRVFHGVASPMPAVAVQLAKKLHAKNAVYLSIAGGVDAVPRSLFPSFNSRCFFKRRCDYGISVV